MSTSIQTAVVIVAAAMVLLLVGCNAAQRGPTQPTLAGTSWRLVSWSPDAPETLDPVDVAAELEITAEFEGDRIAGKSAVNRYFGPVTVNADRVGDFKTGMVGGTMMAGSESAMRAEQTYLRLLQLARRFEIVDGALHLSDADERIILTFRRAD